MRKSFIKKIVNYSVIIIFILLTGFFYSHVNVKNNVYDTRVDNADWKDLGDIGDKVIVQNFTSKENYINGIQLQIATSCIDNSDNYFNYALEDTNGNVLGKSKILIQEIKSTRINTLSFEEPIDINAGELYRVRFWQTRKDYNATSSISYITPATDGHTFYIDDNETDGTLVFRTYTNRFDTETYIVYIVFAIIVVMFLKLLFHLFRI